MATGQLAIEQNFRKAQSASNPGAGITTTSMYTGGTNKRYPARFDHSFCRAEPGRRVRGTRISALRSTKLR